MKTTLPIELLLDIQRTAEWAVQTFGVINISVLAEQVRHRNERNNVALEDIEQEFLLVGQRLNATMEFNRLAEPFIPMQPAMMN